MSYTREPEPSGGRANMGNTLSMKGGVVEKAEKATVVRISAETLERYERLAEQTGRPCSFYFNEALEESIDRLEYEYGILKRIEDYRAGRAKTVCLDELEDSLGLAN